MKKFGLIGNPISRSLSPKLFRAAYPDGGMTYDLIETGTVEEALESFRKNYDAVNVTAPYKESAFKAADRADVISRSLGATNLLIKKDGRLEAFNTDFWAVTNILRLHKMRFDDANVLVVGCGGAGKAAALASVNLHLTTILANRSMKRARDFCFSTGGIAPISLESIPDQVQASNIGIIIYTVPAAIDSLGKIPLKGKVVIEANYSNPCLKELCAEKGALYVPGQEWLVEQALTGFTLMTGTAPDEQVLRDCCLQQTPC